MSHARNMKITIFCCTLSIFTAITQCDPGSISSEIIAPETSDLSLRRGNQDGTDTGDREQYLRITSEMKNQSLVSGEKAQFKCKVDGYPTNQMTYTWYKDNMVISSENNRISIQTKQTGSRLRIKELYTTDTGRYRCEASNTIRRVHTSAYLTVSFSLPPVEEGHQPTIPLGKCQIYRGEACKSLLGGKSIYLPPLTEQAQIEKDFQYAINHISNRDSITEKCQTYTYPASCHFVFPTCKLIDGEEIGTTKATAIKLCREDCERMKYDICRKEFLNSGDDVILQQMFKSNCSSLPSADVMGSECTSIGLPSINNKEHVCYNSTGSAYRGTASVSKSGKRCGMWPHNMLIRFPELVSAYNYCRNPGNQMDAPWCFVNTNVKELCQVEKCVKPSEAIDMVIILVPSVAIPLVIGCIALAFCFCRRRNNGNLSKQRNSGKSTAGTLVDMTALSWQKSKIVELSGNSVHLLMEIGDGQFGKVYKAKVLPNPKFSTNFAVAVKTLQESCLSPQLEEFQKEVDVFSELQHENVACLKAIVVQPPLRCMLFEYTNSVDLHEYLVSHSPQADFAKPLSSASSHASTTIEPADFVRMAIQIACGMEYLSSNNFIHRDLAARNVLICGNMDLKICNLGVVRDSYLSSYYRSPQGGQMLPIRWMAPESLQNWQFSDKSAVWSFGVVIWEMFSYGMQPYCGFSNHEVLELISQCQYLACPDQCPARIYSVMHECWLANPGQRPQFKDLRAKLQGWESSNTTRVTSHLAQGIHRQLTNVMRDGSGHYTQYTPQASSIGGSSNLTYSSSVPGTSPSPPPPQYPGSFPMSSSTYTTHPAPPGVNPSSQRFHSSPGTTEPFVTPAGPNTYQPGQQHNASSTNNAYYANYNQNYQNNLMNQQQRRGQSYRTVGFSQSSQSSSCASSSKDQFPPMPAGRPVVRENHYQDVLSGASYSNGQQHFSRPDNRPLSGVMENDNDDGNDDEKLEVRPISSKPPTYPEATNSSQNRKIIKNETVSSKPFHEADSSDMSTSSIKATSCDSGLPIDDVDGHAIDLKTPLMGHPPRTAYKPPLHGGTPKKFT